MQKKKNHPSLQESLNAAKQFYFVLICLDLTKTFYQKKIVVTNLCILSQSQYEVIMNSSWFTLPVPLN